MMYEIIPRNLVKCVRMYLQPMGLRFCSSKNTVLLLSFLSPFATKNVMPESCLLPLTIRLNTTVTKFIGTMERKLFRLMMI